MERSTARPTIGPVTRGQFWECTAVPEIRRQAEWLAGSLTATWGQTTLAADG